MNDGWREATARIGRDHQSLLPGCGCKREPGTCQLTRGGDASKSVALVRRIISNRAARWAYRLRRESNFGTRFCTPATASREFGVTALDYPAGPTGLPPTTPP